MKICASSSREKPGDVPDSGRIVSVMDDRFTSEELTKIAALQNDPDITRDIVNRNYLSLIRNRRIVAAANDTEIGELMRKFEFEKALDHALKPKSEPKKERP